MVDTKLLEKIDINEGITLFKQTDGAILLDVRRIDEYSAGHIAESINIPVEEIETTSKKIIDKNIPLFVYCRSGVRSTKATEALYEMGYTKVLNIGGILDYKGELVE